MCGIIGAISYRDVIDMLVKGLRLLEYRGYDSAGIAIIDKKGKLKRVRMQGKVQALEHVLKETKIAANLGIAHTRWATHGKPCEQNAHPHLSQGEIAIVHNGIIENHEKLRQKLQNLGYQFTSETDTEAAAHLIHYHYQKTQSILHAVQTAAKEMKGAFALVVIHQKHQELIGIRRGSPLVVGVGEKESFIASDALAFTSAKEIIYLKENDSVKLTNKDLNFYDEQGNQVTRKHIAFDHCAQTVSKGPYRHFMLKEIYEQSKVLADTVEGRINSLKVLRSSFGESMGNYFEKIKNIHIVACGTSYHAGLVARYWLETLTNCSTNVEIASEYRYREVVVPEDTIFIAVSQSGETADTIAALRKAKSLNYLTNLIICNVATSTLVREGECVFITRAGIEIGVASTKAFTTQLAAFLMFAAALAQNKHSQTIIDQLKTLPSLCKNALKMDKEIANLVSIFVNKQHALFLGRGVQYPVALEGALKLKEISYIHAEAYPAGELKHGPLALVDENMPVVAVAPNDELFDKIKSNLHEVSARGGKLIVLVDDKHNWRPNGAYLIKIPNCGSWIAPIIYTIPLQLLAYHVGVAKGTDIDQPRNLAKSVTVE